MRRYSKALSISALNPQYLLLGPFAPGELIGEVRFNFGSNGDPPQNGPLGLVFGVWAHAMPPSLDANGFISGRPLLWDDPAQTTAYVSGIGCEVSTLPFALVDTSVPIQWRATEHERYLAVYIGDSCQVGWNGILSLVRSDLEVSSS